MKKADWNALKPWLGLGAALGLGWMLLRRKEMVPGGAVLSSFGPRGGREHMGVDIAAPIGTPIYAPAAGEVVDMSPDGRRDSYGNVVILRHAGEVFTLYAHLDEFVGGMQLGDWVRKGNVVGYVGVTQAPRPAMVSDPHVHFEVLLEPSFNQYGRVVVTRDSPARLNPEPWLSERRALA